MIRAANIADVKNRLSMYLQLVRAGEEIVIRDRNLPVARQVPIAPSDSTSEELALVAGGEMSLPSGPLDAARFWSIGKDLAVSADLGTLAAEAVSQDREERDAGVLGR